MMRCYSTVVAVAALLIIGSCRGREMAEVHREAPVILISIDTLRADRLPMFGYKKLQTPALDAFRRDAILFTNAYSHVPLTLPSHVSMLTGLLPPQNKVRNNIGYVLDPDLPTLPRLLKWRGYETGAAVSAYVLRGSTGLRSSFDFYEDGISNRGNVAIGSLARSGRTTSGIAKQWIAQHQTKPFLFMLHLFEPHAPYEPEEPFRTRYSDAYDGEIATTDAIVGDFLADLKRTGVYDKAIIVVVSDHGEGLGDHGEPEHGIFIYREAIHVPLLLKLPKSKGKGETVSSPVGLVDLLPTIAQLTGTAVPPRLDGKSLLSPADPQRRIYSESLYPRIHLGWSELRSLADVRYHFIQAPKPELYDVSKDPVEHRNIVSEERRVYAAMRQELERYGTAVELPTNINPEEAKKLAALGYLSSSAPAPSGPLPDPKDRIGEIATMIRASDLVRARRYDEAITAFREIVKQNPRLTDAWNQLGTALEAAGRNQEAADVYKTAIETAPELASEFGLRRGSVLLKLERYDEAERHARLAERTNESAMHLLLARIAFARGNYRQAEDEAKTAAGDRSNRIAADVVLAQIYAQQGRAQDAWPIVQRIDREIAEEKAGPIESVNFVRGDVLGRMERYDEAIEAFRKEIELFPANRQTYANLYLVYRVKNRPAEARRVLEEMARAIPSKQTMLFAARTADVLGDEETARIWRRRAAAR